MRNFLIISAILLILSACKKDEKSGDNKISGYSITNISPGSLTIDEVFTDDSSHTIYLLFANKITEDSLPLNYIATFTIPSGATSLPVSGGTATFNSMDERLKYAITAENGNVVEYSVVIRDNQLPNNGFEDWYEATGMNGGKYSEPGKNAISTIWATANNGTSVYNVFGTTPIKINTNTVVQIKTGETTLIPITAGTLFTGTFDINGAIQNPTNPRKATKFGIPYTLRPAYLRFKYSYIPGSRYIKATLNNPTNIFGGFTISNIAGNDMFTAYAILEKREGNNIIEVGRAEINNGELQRELIDTSIPFNYTSDQKPTHLSVVFSSSKDGDFFTGAVGSTLTIDDVELIYQ